MVEVFPCVYVVYPIKNGGKKPESIEVYKIIKEKRKGVRSCGVRRSITLHF
jgi:hypothetical protein